MKVTVKNVISFIEGNSKFYYDYLIGEPEYKREQRLYRLQQCPDCIEENKCTYCGCNPLKKAFVNESCNGGDRFPDMMGEEEWTKYKQDNNL